MTLVYGTVADELARANPSNELAPLKELARRIARTFYMPCEIVVMDYLTSMPTPILSDIELGSALRVGAKEVHKLCSRLVESRILRMESKGFTRKSDGKTFPRTFYVLDYKLLVDSTKWKMMRMERNIRIKVEREMDNRGYICPLCETHYTPLEAMNQRESFKNESGSVDFRFLCRIDRMVLEEDRTGDAVKLGNETLERLNVLISPIMGLIRRCDTVILPKYNPNIAREELAKRIATMKEPTYEGSRQEGSAIPSDLMSSPSETKKSLTTEIEVKKNTLPVWHQNNFSTNQLEKESLESEETQAKAENSKHEETNDAELEKYLDEYRKRKIIQEDNIKKKRKMQEASEDSSEFEEVLKFN